MTASVLPGTGREIRVPVADLTVGQFVVRILGRRGAPDREINSRVSAELTVVTKGMRLVGPGGGVKIVVHPAGRRIIPLANGRRPVSAGDATAIVLTEGE